MLILCLYKFFNVAAAPSCIRRFQFLMQSFSCLCYQKSSISSSAFLRFLCGSTVVMKEISMSLLCWSSEDAASSEFSRANLSCIFYLVCMHYTWLCFDSLFPFTHPGIPATSQIHICLYAFIESHKEEHTWLTSLKLLHVFWTARSEISIVICFMEINGAD